MFNIKWYYKGASKTRQKPLWSQYLYFDFDVNMEYGQQAYTSDIQVVTINI